MEPMTTLSEVIAKLNKDGYTVDFNISGANSLQESLINNPQDFVVDKHYRFEGITDPDDEAIVYAIASIDGQIKGILVNGYGNNSNENANKIVSILQDREG